MIRFDHISKQYRGTNKPALADVSFEVQRGEFVFLIGSSGSGKSSCLRLILKEEKPTRGRIHVLGQDLGSISNRKIPYFRRNLGVVFQDFRLLPNKTVHQNVAFTLQVLGKSRGFIQEAVPDVLNMVGLESKANRMPHELSGGEQQRVAIARAVVNKPQILLADEPTGNLDPATSAGIMAVLERISAGGTTVVMATHEAGIVDRMQKRVIELAGGQLVRDERHGGYGETAAIPIIKQPEPAPAQPEQVVLSTGIIVPVAAPVGTQTQAVPVQAAAAASVPRPATQQQPAAWNPPIAQPPIVQPAAEQQLRPQGGPQPTGQQPAAHAPAPQFTGPIDIEVEQLTGEFSLAARLGLRAAETDDSDEQNVGPVK